MRVVEIEDEVGNIDLCECEEAPSTRILRIIARIKSVQNTSEDSNTTYQAQYAYACGYFD